MNRPFLIPLFALAGLLPALSVRAATPYAPTLRTLPIQGMLLGAGGDRVNGPVPVTFRIYAAPSGGDALHAETDTVIVAGGHFAAVLGDPDGLPAAVAFDRPLFVGIQVDGDPEEMAPRIALRAAPYALALPGMRTEYVRDEWWVQEAYNVVGGYPENFVAPGVIAATIAGGGAMSGGWPSANAVFQNWGTVGGGLMNTAGVPGQPQNGHGGATVAGGQGNEAEGTGATVAGGISNGAIGDMSFVGGGYTNFAYGEMAVIAGGMNNGTGADYATVGGGAFNGASGEAATVPGGEGNTAQGDHSFAAGRYAMARHSGAFVWSDRSLAPTESTADNQFLVRATGGVRFVTGLGADRKPSAGVDLPAGSGSWSSLSDRAAKTDIAPVNPRAVLERLAAVPLSTWRYRAQAPEVRHIGPMAQDFAAAFGVGEDDRRIATVDADGVALAAIQGLYELVRTQDAHIADLEARILALEQAAK